MDWFRSHHGAPSDSKLLLIAKRSGQPRAIVTAVWWELLDYASQHEERGSLEGLDPELIAVQQDIDPEAVTAILQAMQDKGMILEGHITNWEKRQPTSDGNRDTTAAERMRRYRERKKDADRNAEDDGVTDERVTEEVTPATDVTEGVTARDGNVTDNTRNVTAPLREGYGLDTDSDTEKENSVPIGTGRAPPATAPPVGVVKSIFDVGVSLLASGGVKERQARSLIGKWRKGYGDVALFEALQAAEREGATEPVAFIEACLRQSGRSPPGGRSSGWYDPAAAADHARAVAQRMLEETEREIAESADA